MGSRGPAPKRSTERHGHRSTADQPELVEQAGEVDRPAPSENWHSTARGWYDSLTESGQSRFYEPSDWQQAHFCADLIHRTLTDEKINAQLVAQVRGLMADLLSSESARRRVSLEIVRVPADPAPTSGGNVTSMTGRRKRADAS
jgi:hypothetical protein